MLQESEELHLQSELSVEPHEGNLKSIGYGYYSNPQWIIFGITYIFAICLSLLMMTQVFTYGYHYYVGKLSCLYLLYRYLSLAFSNPGLSYENPIKILENHRYCQICQIHVRKFTRHCETCNVCIEGYDHHCVFIGKCIGSRNMGEFKEFLCLILCIMIYGIIISVSMVSNVQKVGTKGN